jgi:hypothetical protein
MRRGWKAALTALLAAVLMFAGVGTANADDPAAVTGGSIAGVVTSEADGSPIAGIYVQAQNDSGSSMASAMTGADGSYRIDGLLAGPHRVHFLTSGTPYISEYWNSASSYFQATTVDVQDGVVATGIDAALSIGGSISGIVTHEDGTPVASAFVSANGTTGGFGNAMTDASGAYTIQGLAADSYVVQFSSGMGGLISEYWDNASDYFSATRVPVASGGAVTGIDAVLVAGGSLQGVVTKASDGSAVTAGWVAVLDANGNSVAQGWLSWDGSYRIDGVRPGDYEVKFISSDPNLLPQYWANAATAADATPVTIVAGQTVSGIDAALSAAVHISGTVTRSSDGQAVRGTVSATDADGRAAGYTSINIDGTYSLPLAPGSYLVQFRSADDTLVSEYWKDARTEAEATRVVVADGQDATGIDASLDAAAVITGTIHPDGEGQYNLWIEAYSSDSTTPVAMAYARADGTFRLVLPAGTYTLKASGVIINSRETVVSQYYDGTRNPKKATPVTLGAGETLGGVDFTLSVHGNPKPPKPGSLVGGR